MARIVAYQVQNDGNWDPVAFSQDKLTAKEVFILVNEEKKQIWIWIGGKSDVKSRFISSQAAQNIRQISGLTFRVRSADQGVEPNDFWECIDLIPKEGIGPSNEKKPQKTRKTAKTATTKKRGRPRKKSTSNKTKTLTKGTLDQALSLESPNAENMLASQLKEKNKITEIDPSFINTPTCPKCGKGNLLPYSGVIQVTARKKEVAPIVKWVCSSCQFTPIIPEID